MSLTHRTFALIDPAETAKFAACMAPHLEGGDVILLQGDVGAGKTHFARAFVQNRLGRTEDVPSPTFTLVQTYETGNVDIWHADLYRLTSTSEVEELGLLAAFETEICLVEWPDRLGDLAPPNALELTFVQGGDENTRHVTATSESMRWAHLLDSCHP